MYLAQVRTLRFPWQTVISIWTTVALKVNAVILIDMAKDPRKSNKRKVEEKEPEETNGEVMEVIESEVEEDSAEESDESESEVEAPTNQVLQTEKPVYRDRFREYYMTMLTSEFGDDLDAIRKDNKFEEKRSLPILIRSLEQGINIFSPEERKLILTQQ